jgi:hypothetical protein
MGDPATDLSKLSPSQIRVQEFGVNPWLVDPVGEAFRALSGLIKKLPTKKSDSRTDRLYDLANAYQAAIKSGDPENIRKFEKTLSQRDLVAAIDFAAKNGMLSQAEKDKAYAAMGTKPAAGQLGFLGVTQAENPEPSKPVTFGDQPIGTEPAANASPEGKGFDFKTDENGKAPARFEYQDKDHRTEQPGLKPIQTMLAKAGAYAAGANSSPDGYFGDDTLAAVKAFQAQNGLDPTGALDEETLNRLKLKSERGR